MQLTIIILFTAALGSFCNNVISAYINNGSVDIGRSTCFCGERKLNPLELLPVISYFLLRGKCKECNKVISARYIVVEMLSITFGIIYFVRFGFSSDFIINYLSFQILLTIGVIDYYKYIIPNSLVFFLFFLCVFKYLLLYELPFINIITASVAVIIFLLANQIYFNIKGQFTIGAGDIKLISVLILFFGIPNSLFGLWISAIIAIPGYYLLKFYVRRFHNAIQIPFGLFLSIGYVFTDMIYDSLINSYLIFLAA